MHHSIRAKIPSGKCHARKSTCVNVKLRRRLLAGGASVHIDFHADRHFDDLGGLPGHFGSPCNRTNFVLLNNLVPFEKFASEIFGRNPMCCYVAARKELTVLCEPMSNQRQINGFKMVRLIRVTGCGATHNGEFRIKNA